MKMGRGIEMKEVARKEMAKEMTGECEKILIYLPAFPFSISSIYWVWLELALKLINNQEIFPSEQYID